jgi:hypothetical protein
MAGDIRQFARSFTFSEGSGAQGGESITAYEDFDGEAHLVGGGGGEEAPPPFTVRKTYYQATPVLTVRVGDTFEVPKDFGRLAYGDDYDWDALAVRCTSASISDEVIRFVPPDGITRLWEVALEGTTQPAGGGGTAGMSVKRLEWDMSEELNGGTARTLSGRLVALLKSAEPRKKARVSATGTAPACPYRPGQTYSFLGVGMLVTATSSKKNAVEENGAVLATLYDYTLDLEA